ncbi:(2Fe-2S)-binding protein [Williamsia soli]
MRRTSCCLIYQATDGDKCTSCPRRPRQPVRPRRPAST